MKLKTADPLALSLCEDIAIDEMLTNINAIPIRDIKILENIIDIFNSNENALIKKINPPVIVILIPSNIDALAFNLPVENLVKIVPIKYPK